MDRLHMIAPSVEITFYGEFWAKERLRRRAQERADRHGKRVSHILWLPRDGDGIKALAVFAPREIPGTTG